MILFYICIFSKKRVYKTLTDKRFVEDAMHGNGMQRSWWILGIIWINSAQGISAIPADLHLHDVGVTDELMSIVTVFHWTPAVMHKYDRNYQVCFHPGDFQWVTKAYCYLLISVLKSVNSRPPRYLCSYTTN